MIRTIRPLDRPDPGSARVDRANGFSLHAGVSCEDHQKDKRERFCRYITRPAVAVPRLSLNSTGKVVYTLKMPFSDETMQMAFDAVDFIVRLAALVLKPRFNLTRYHQEIIDRILARLHETGQATRALPLLTPPSRRRPRH